MRDSTALAVPKWPFVAGGALLVAFGAFLLLEHPLPVSNGEIAGSVLSVALGIGCFILPFALQYRHAGKLTESANFADAVNRLQKLEQLAAQIGYATNQWHVVRESCDKTAGVAKEIASGMVGELKSFRDFLDHASQGEKATLRLEVEKLRRAEAEWLQTVVRILDHVFALTQAAQRSQQPGVAEQLGKFQFACHDAVRRMGVVPFTAARTERFNPEKHRLADDGSEPGAEAQIEEVLAPGYTFQGRLVRPAVVQVADADGAAKPEAADIPVAPNA